MITPACSTGGSEVARQERVLDGKRGAAAKDLSLKRRGIPGRQLQHVAQLQQLGVIGRHGRAAHMHLVQLADLHARAKQPSAAGHGDIVR